MEKQAIKIDYKKPVKIDFNDQEVIVVPYIDMTTRIVIIKNYVGMLFGAGDPPSNLVGAEYALMLGVLDSNTNVDISNEIDIDAIVGSGLWDLVRNKIENYQELRSEIGSIVRQVREEIAFEKSMGNSFDKIAKSIEKFFQNISNLDLSESGIKDLLDKMKLELTEYKKITQPEIKPVKKTRKKVAEQE